MKECYAVEEERGSGRRVRSVDGHGCGAEGEYYVNQNRMMYVCVGLNWAGGRKCQYSAHNWK